MGLPLSSLYSALSQSHRVIVPDHMGFGKSATPRDREYSLKSHVENLTRLVDALDLKDVTFVIQDWGGLIGAAYSLRHPDRIKRLFLLNTLSGYGKIPFDGLTPWFQFVKTHHDAKTLHEILGNLDANALSVMKIMGFENSAAVDSNWIAAYSAAFPTKDDCLGAIEFPLDAVLGRIAPYIKEGFPLLDNLKSKPAMLTVGMKDRTIAPDRQLADFRAVWPGRPIIKLPNAGHCGEHFSGVSAAINNL